MRCGLFCMETKSIGPAKDAKTQTHKFHVYHSDSNLYLKLILTRFSKYLSKQVAVG